MKVSILYILYFKQQMQHLLNFLKLIPQNKLMSYKQLWEIFWIHPRKVAQILTQNKQQDKYPCYKIINSNKKISWYNLGVKEKIKKLEKDGFIIENNKIIKHTSDNKIFRKPKFSNFFVAFPIEDKNFQNLAKQLKQINNWDFTIQKPDSPHITLRFFGKLDFETLHQIIEKTKKLKIKPKKVYFNQVNNFWKKIRFYKPENPAVLTYTYHKFHEITDLEKGKRPFKPHLTILRVKKDSFQQIKPQIFEILKQYKFSLYPNKLRFYVAVDNNFQVPLIDLNIG